MKVFRKDKVRRICKFCIKYSRSGNILAFKDVISNLIVTEATNDWRTLLKHGFHARSNVFDGTTWTE